MKKGQGLSLNVIIIAAIALIVLVILSVIFIGRLGRTTTQVEQCPGVCIDDSGDCKVDVGEYYAKATDKSCFDDEDKKDNDMMCCVGVGDTNV